MDLAGPLGKSIAPGRPNAHVEGAATTQDSDMTVSHGGLDAAVRQTAASFARPNGSPSALQLVTSFGAFLAGCAAMYLVLPLSSLDERRGRLVRFRDAV